MDTKKLLQQGYRYGLSLTHNPAFAEDLLHDAWVSMLDISAPQNIGYLFKTMRNKYLNHRKHMSIVPFVVLDEAFSDDELIDDKSDFFQCLANQQMLEKSLGKLSSLEREVIYLYYYEGYTTVEISELVSLGKGTVCSLIYRTRIKLKKILEDDMSQVVL